MATTMCVIFMSRTSSIGHSSSRLAHGRNTNGTPAAWRMGAIAAPAAAQLQDRQYQAQHQLTGAWAQHQRHSSSISMMAHGRNTSGTPAVTRSIAHGRNTRGTPSAAAAPAATQQHWQHRHQPSTAQRPNCLELKTETALLLTWGVASHRLLLTEEVRTPTYLGELRAAVRVGGPRVCLSRILELVSVSALADLEFVSRAFSSLSVGPW